MQSGGWMLDQLLPSHLRLHCQNHLTSPSVGGVPVGADCCTGKGLQLCQGRRFRLFSSRYIHVLSTNRSHHSKAVKEPLVLQLSPFPCTKWGLVPQGKKLSKSDSLQIIVLAGIQCWEASHTSPENKSTMQNRQGKCFPEFVMLHKFLLKNIFPLLMWW